MELTNRERDLFQALQHVCMAASKNVPARNMDWAEYHLTRATQGCDTKTSEIIHDWLTRARKQLAP